MLYGNAFTRSERGSDQQKVDCLADDSFKSYSFPNHT